MLETKFCLCWDLSWGKKVGRRRLANQYIYRESTRITYNLLISPPETTSFGAFWFLVLCFSKPHFPFPPSSPQNPRRSKQPPMEDDGIHMVLGRATELHLKISNCIRKATSTASLRQDPSPATENGAANDGGSAGETEDDEEVERLLNICDALESLETQLSSLQVFPRCSWLGLYFSPHISWFVGLWLFAVLECCLNCFYCSIW